MPRSEDLRGQAFAVGLVVAVPAAEGGGAGVGKQKWQRRRFNVAVAKPIRLVAEPELRSEDLMLSVRLVLQQKLM